MILSRKYQLSRLVILSIFSERESFLAEDEIMPDYKSTRKLVFPREHLLRRSLPQSRNGMEKARHWL
jgi:hypothetical protein